MTTKIADEIQLQVAQMRTYPQMSPKESQELITISKNENKEISLYSGEIATPNDVLVATNRLKAAFPKMSGSFFSLLAERIIENNFTPERLSDAVNQLIDNFNYKELNIADIIKFDKKVKLYSYNDVCKMVSKGEASFADFVIKEIDGTHYRVKKTDLK